MRPVPLCLLLSALTALAAGRLPQSVFQLVDRLREDQRFTEGKRDSGHPPSPVESNSTDATTLSPAGARDKRAALHPLPPPIWIKRRKDSVRETPSSKLKRSTSSQPPPPALIWIKRSTAVPLPPPTSAKRSPVTKAEDDDDDVFGLPLTPDDFTNAVQLAADALLSGPGAEDPIELAGLYEGDIAHADGDDDGLGALIAADDAGGGRTRNAVRGRHRLWSDGELPYVISSSFSRHERAVIAAAAQQLAERSCLRLVPRSGQADYVHIKKGRGCSSDVGRFGGKQELSLGNGCVYRGVVAHELLHAAGFWHEQSRADRDEHVVIHRDNIRVGMAYNFDKKPWSRTLDLGEPYDVGSVLHYGPKAFAADPSQPTITPLVPSARMGQRDGPTDLDIAKLNRLYDCGETPTAAPEPAGCEDVNEACPFWADSGECDRNPNWMAINCAKSCDTCSACEDRSGSCDAWAAENQCTVNWDYMSVFCRRACGLCDAAGGVTGCGDTAAHCAEWSKAGECAANPDYMAVHCKKACGAC